MLYFLCISTRKEWRRVLGKKKVPGYPNQNQPTKSISKDTLVLDINKWETEVRVGASSFINNTMRQLQLSSTEGYRKLSFSPGRSASWNSHRERRKQLGASLQSDSRWFSVSHLTRSNSRGTWASLMIAFEPFYRPSKLYIRF